MVPRLKDPGNPADGTLMAQSMTLPNDWSGRLSLATPNEVAGDAAGLTRLPAEWEVIDSLVLEDIVIDHVVVGPNGIFTVVLDPDPDPATIEDDGLYRDGVRVTTPVKTALIASSELRARIGPQLFAYPILISQIEGDHHQLERLGVVPGSRVAEAIWSHPGLPLRRSSRLETVWALHSLT